MNKKIKQKTRESRVKKFIQQNKFLRDKKYYKDIKISEAAFDSWAAQGEAGDCDICGIGHYNLTLTHKRFTTKSGQKPTKYYWNDFGSICYSCLKEIEKQCNYKFLN